MMKYFLIVWLMILGFVNIRSGLVNSVSSSDEKCTECHSDLTGYKNLHPVMEDGCTTCHEPDGDNHPEKGGFKLVENVPALCFVCHEAFDKKNIHSPASDGDCLSCHSPHGSDNESLLTEPKEELCMICHEMGTGENFKPHFSDFETACSDCHDPHQSDNMSLLKQPMPNVCFECHEDESNAAEEVSVHYAYAEESCTTCHKPHGSELPGMLSEKTPDLCFMCHEQGEYSNPHEPYAKGECTECHSPHASGNETLLKQDKKELCLRCHTKTYKTDSTYTANIGQQLKKNEYQHGAIEMDGCSTCHTGHGAQNPELLRGNYPTDYYAEGVEATYTLCFDCHDPAILEEGTESSGTGFSNGKTNLHFVHLKGEKGRSCSLCHDVHAAKNSHLIKEEVTFGDWSMKMNYKVTDNGGSCMPGCHGELTYDRSFVEK